jgi:hypothetical protein
VARARFLMLARTQSPEAAVRAGEIVVGAPKHPVAVAGFCIGRYRSVWLVSASRSYGGIPAEGRSAQLALTSARLA